MIRLYTGLSPMQTFINSFLENAFTKFKQYQSSNRHLCELKDLDFQAGHSPCYSNKWVQSLYLMRYFYAYFTEYYCLYQNTLPCLETDPKILSIGCGCGVDGAALYFASPSLNFQYIGYDIVDWELNVKNFLPSLPNIDIRLDNITTTCFPISNVLMFPKSLSDIECSTFSSFVNNLSADFFEKKLIILSSIMAEGSGYDVARMRIIVTKMESFGYKLTKGSVEPIPLQPSQACCLHIGATFPDEIKDFIGNLRDQCKSYNDECLECKISRHPKLTTHSARFQQLVLERE